jgi:tetratricopeptide (TPR) repeat protein
MDDPHYGLPLYSRAFLLNCTTEEPEVGAVLLYNLGLIFHKRGNLERAAKVYQLSLQVLREKHGSEVDEILILAVLYNLGHAYSQLFQPDKVCTCFNYLRKVLHDTSLEYGEDALDSDEHSFFLNILLLESNHLTLAPAA